MADIEIKRAHELGLPGARKAAEEMAGRLDEKFDLTSRWQGNTMHFERPGVTGNLLVTATELALTVNFGFLLKMMKGPIEKAVHEQLDLVLAKPAKPAAKAAAKATPKAAASTAAKTAPGGRKKSAP